MGAVLDAFAPHAEGLAVPEVPPLAEPWRLAVAKGVETPPASAGANTPPGSENTTGAPLEIREVRSPRVRWSRVAGVIVASGLVAGAFALAAVRQPRTAPAPSSEGDVELPSGRARAAEQHAQALEHWGAGSLRQAKSAWRAALAHDETFAPAALHLGLVLPLSDESRRLLHRALDHRGVLEPLDAALLDASRAAFDPVPDLARWEHDLERLISEHDRWQHHYFLAHVRQLRGRLARALEALPSPKGKPAHAAALHALRGRIEKSRDRPKEALAAFDECLSIAPRATDCLAGKSRLLAVSGDCAGMERNAQRWIALDESDPAASEALAMALASLGAPIDAVREALGAKWEKQRAEAGGSAVDPWVDRYRLELLAGDIGAAIAIARRARSAVPTTASLLAHYEPSVWLALAAVEAGDDSLVREVSASFVKRSRAWIPDNPRHVGLPLLFLGILQRAGGMEARERDEQRQHWIGIYDRTLRAAGGEVDVYTHALPWVLGYAAGTTSVAEARTAIAALPRFEPLPAPGAHEGDIDLVIGQVFALDGQPARALPYLERAAQACLLLENPFATLYALHRFGTMLARAGESGRARRAYETVLRYWGNAQPHSRRVALVRDALRALPP
jgi:serine/threonine-protein kinase